ncbi:MAG: hypothetical protein IPL01_10385 [Acidobacteria bacterium]|nr:hypothetical protein [Acidobacteriota bacterium]
MIDILHIALLTFLFISIIATVFFVYRYATLRGRIPSIVQEEFELWRRREEMMMQDKVRNRFEEWRDREVKAIQATLQKEALIQAHSLFKDWSQNELEAMRREQREIAHREATTDLIKWKHEQEKIIRLDAVQRSQAVTIGKVTEHIVSTRRISISIRKMSALSAALSTSWSLTASMTTRRIRYAMSSLLKSKPECRS